MIEQATEHVVEQRKGIGNLVPFPKGQSGNPKGGSGYKRVDYERELHRRLTKQGKGSVQDLVETILKVACDPSHKHFMDAQNALLARLMPIQDRKGSSTMPTIVLEVSPGTAASIQPRAVHNEQVMPTIEVQPIEPSTTPSSQAVE